MDSPVKAGANKPNPWLIVSLGLALILLIVLANNYLQPTKNGSGDLVVIDSQQAGSDLVDFINQIFGPQIGGTVSLQSVNEVNGIYEVNILASNVPAGQPAEQIVYMTKDGKFFIPQVIDINTVKANFQAAQQQPQVTPDDLTAPIDANIEVAP